MSNAVTVKELVDIVVALPVALPVITPDDRRDKPIGSSPEIIEYVIDEAGGIGLADSG